MSNKQFNIDNMYLVTTVATLREDWKKYFPPVKVGNLKDPEKIALKKQEWENTAAVEATKGRLTSRLAEWTVYTLPGDVVCSGSKDTASLYNFMAGHLNSYFFAFNAYARLGSVLMENLSGAIPFSEWNWYIGKDPMESLIVDPVYMLKGAHEEKEQILDYFSIPREIDTMDQSTQLTHLSNLVKKIVT